MSRPKGYADWNPNAATQLLLAQVNEVFAQYRDQLPLTARQIFYRMVGAYEYPKDERAYKRLTTMLVRARRAQLIPFHYIRDDGTAVAGGGGWDSVEQFWAYIRSAHRSFSINRMVDQQVQIELWCEAAGMLPQMERASRFANVNCYSTGGFSSVTVTKEIADRVVMAWDDESKGTVFLHVGDYDPSGESIFTSMTEDVLMFVAGHIGADARDAFRAHRVALTEDQVVAYDLPTAPPKYSDTRTANWDGETCQAEALPPDLLAQIVTEAVSEHVDTDILEQTRETELKEREDIRVRLAGA